jgi:dGTPase
MKTIREQYEELEEKFLSPYATLSKNSKGRLKKERKCPIRTEFQRDRDRIIHSRAFRRLKHKTQVFISPEGDHYRTRLTHTLEVMQISRTISRALRLNEDLTEAISLGHDLGHTPFGHLGEEILDKICQEYNLHFRHNEYSLTIVDFLERNGKGLNLTYEVRDGILKHSKGSRDLKDVEDRPSTLEGEVVRISDRIAYLNHDIADSIRAGVIKGKDIPKKIINLLGKSQNERINTMVIDVIKNSLNKPYIKMSKEIEEATDELKNFLFEKVYLSKFTRGEYENIEKKLRFLFEYYLKNLEEVPYFKFLKKKKNEIGKIKIVCYYIAGMTDRYASSLYDRLANI